MEGFVWTARYHPEIVRHSDASSEQRYMYCRELCTDTVNLTEIFKLKTVSHCGVAIIAANGGAWVDVHQIWIDESLCQSVICLVTVW
jgi:hypothetical protein